MEKYYKPPQQWLLRFCILIAILKSNIIFKYNSFNLSRKVDIRVIPNLMNQIDFFIGKKIYRIVCKKNAVLYEISLKENSPYKQGCVNFYGVITRILLTAILSPYIQGRIVKKVALFCRLYGMQK